MLENLNGCSLAKTESGDLGNENYNSTCVETNNKDWNYVAKPTILTFPKIFTHYFQSWGKIQKIFKKMKTDEI